MRSQQAKTHSPGRNDQLIRVIELIGHLDRLGAVDLYALAEHFGRSKKTIQRDLGALEAAGIPLESQVRGKRKTWRIDFKSKFAKLGSLLDASHYLALRVAMEPGVALRNSPSVFATLEDLGKKIEDAVGPSGKAQLASIEQAFYSYEKRAYKNLPPDVLGPVVGAISQQRICRVTYRAPHAQREKTYEILPLKLFAYDGALYLVCHAPKFDSILKLNLQRLLAIKVLQRRGETPSGFDPEAIEHAAFGLVAGGPLTTYRLRFDPGVAPFIRERVWHPTQKLRELSNGCVELKFRCEASYEVGAWVQSWGGNVEVLAPASLRAELKELGQWLAAKYGTRRRP